MDSSKIGKIVQFHREKSGLSQERLAELAGIGKTSVFDIEKGKTTVRIDTIFKLLSVLNIKIELKSPLIELFIQRFNEKS